MIKKSIILFVLFYLVSAHSQQTIDKLNSNQLKLPKETISKALSIDAAGQVKSSATSDVELGYLSGVLSSVQDQINDKANDADAVHLTGDESISGVKTLTGKLVTSSTINASIPCPVMTQTQRDAIVTPVTGDCVFNSDTSLSNIYDGAIWKAMGGSGGGIGLWVTANGYAVDDVVIESNNIYICLTAHTSGTFATDLASLYWLRLSTDVTGATGLLPLATGGTNKSITASDGSIVYSDTDSLELLAPGTSGQILQTNGAAAPTFVNKSISGKAQNTTAVTIEEMQVPNNLLTATDTNKYLNETGNTNILSNPSFEHSTFDTGWTNNGTEVGVVETSDVIEGKKSISFNPSSETINLTQTSTLYAAAFADGVQGVAMCRIKSAVALSMCAIQNSAVSTTDCVTTSTDSRWSLYKIPFILGSTNNGVSIAGSALTGAVKVDDCFVGTANIIDTQPTIGPWTTFTPTGSWTANTTYSGKYRQVGESIEIQYFLTVSGAPTSATLTINMPTGFTINTSKLGDPSAGSNTRIDSSGAILDSGTLVYATLVAVYNSTTSLLIRSGTALAAEASVTQAAPMVWASGDKLWLYTKVPVTQFSGSTSTYSSQCGANCVDTFSANISSTGVVSGENVNWVNGNCVQVGSTYTCSFSTSIFTVAPNCTATPTGTATGAQASSSSSSSIVNTWIAAVGTAAPFTLLCQKQGADFTATRTIQGSFNEVNVSPGISRPKTCHYAFGGASATLAAPTLCTTGTCVNMKDTCGGMSTTFSSTGIYVLTVPSGTFANDSYITTTSQHGVPANLCGAAAYLANSSGGATINVRCAIFAGGSDGTLTNAHSSFTIQGSAP